MTLTELETRLDAIESRQAIDGLIAKYALAFDNGDETLLATLWHDDACLLLGANGDFFGREAILAAAPGLWRAMPHMHHWMANALVTVDGNEAAGVVAADCLFYNVELGTVQVSGQYRDRYSRRGGRWAFVQRKFETHFVTPLAHWSPIAGTEAFGKAAINS